MRGGGAGLKHVPRHVVGQREGWGQKGYYYDINLCLSQAKMEEAANPRDDLDANGKKVNLKDNLMVVKDL